MQVNPLAERPNNNDKLMQYGVESCWFDDIPRRVESKYEIYKEILPFVIVDLLSSKKKVIDKTHLFF